VSEHFQWLAALAASAAVIMGIIHVGHLIQSVQSPSGLLS
jgi:hypothetical protein